MHESDIRVVGHHGGQYKMKYLYLDTETDKVILIAKKKIEDHPNTEYVVNDDFDLTKEMPDEGGGSIRLEGFLTATEFLARYNSNYVAKRVSAYPSIEDQLDNIYHNGVEGWKADIKAIKDANPKENN